MLMEQGGLGGGMFSSISSGMLGLEMPLHQQQNPQNPQNPPHTLHHPQMVAYATTHHEPDHHPQTQMKATFPYASSKPAKQALTLSDDDEAGMAPDDSGGDGKRKMSPWQRMKWTDTMVRLLIMAVFYIGDEGASELNDPKKKSSGLLQKKGKWKSVSRAMMEKGFYVSPQQCEDKFNDLNKRYKRVNDILGRGTACRVVENQALLETMDLTPKMKEEVRKLLNSKHLFFREMCAYHSSCGHVGGSSGAATGAGAHHSPEAAAEPSQGQQPQVQQQRCFHSVENPAVGDNAGRTETETSKMAKGASGEEECDDDEEDDLEYDDDDDDEDEDEVVEGGSRGHGGHDDHENNERHSRKRPRKSLFSLSSAVVQQLSSEVMSVIQDGTKSPWEKKQWLRTKMLQLEEQQVSYHGQAFELEKQRWKWVKFSSKKEREMERAKLENERRRLEIERMVLLIRQKELELLDLQQQMSSNKRSDPSSITG